MEEILQKLVLYLRACHQDKLETPPSSTPHATDKTIPEAKASLVSAEKKEVSAHAVPQNADDYVASLVRAQNKGVKDSSRHLGKRMLWPYFLQEKRQNSPFYRALHISAKEEKELRRLLVTKPIRTSSGVTTVTILTKPYPCSGTCIFCPNDIRMPKSYMHNEPACQRAELLSFDPYLQVAKRLQVLEEMGHDTGKVELIILGGTWTDYPSTYRIWFVKRALEAMNEIGQNADTIALLEKHYEQEKTSKRSEETAKLQAKINAHEISYNEAYHELSDLANGPAKQLSSHAKVHTENLSSAEQKNKESVLNHALVPSATWEELEDAQRENERARSRCVGLVIETRPDQVSAEALWDIRRLGATKVQMGIQTTDERILELNARHMKRDDLKQAFALLRLFGFKIHIHAMLNLLGATPEKDAADYKRLMEDAFFRPDEVKLYPCALVAGTKLQLCFEAKTWTPYSYEQLLGVLAADLSATPLYTRVTRMIRDISSRDILVGNKKTNLRQDVEKKAYEDLQVKQEGGQEASLQEIRSREIRRTTPRSLGMSVCRYETSVSEERFLQLTTPENLLAGFCRLSLPRAQALSAYPKTPADPGCAMIREVHVYGLAVGVGKTGATAQHQGLGKALVEEAALEAREAGYKRLSIISAIGTRDYYRGLGFEDAGLYLEKTL